MTEPLSSQRYGMFVSRLADASLKDRLVACVGAGLGVLAADVLSTTC
ncbi:hypothetical protein [Sphingorhabdus sp.]